MALQQYRIAAFSGLNQSGCENNIDPGESPDAHNMDTEGGRLAVARGYVRHSGAAHPAPENVRRMTVWNKGGTRRFVTVSTDGLHVLTEGDTEWTQLYDVSPAALSGMQQDFQKLKIGSTEVMLFANGQTQMQKWDGTSAQASLFGSAAGLSDVHAGFVELYYSRLFAAGDPDAPCRLYWSSVPGDSRTVEDWTADEASENTGGGHVEVGTDSDPITGLFALSNQLLIFKRDSLYRLLGDRPSNFRIYPVNAVMAQPLHTSCVRCGDVLYFLTATGLYYFDGQTVTRAYDADKVKTLLAEADLSACLAAACRDKLCFALRTGGAAVNNAILVYDLNRGAYMLRDGFTVIDLCADGGTLFLLDGDGYVCRFDEGETYGGEPICASWNTPLTDLSMKIGKKQLRELYLRGSGGVIAVTAATDSGKVFFERLMPQKQTSVLEATLSGDGRAFSLCLENENGSRFSIDGGVELLLDVQRRVL